MVKEASTHHIGLRPGNDCETNLYRQRWCDVSAIVEYGPPGSFNQCVKPLVCLDDRLGLVDALILQPLSHPLERARKIRLKVDWSGNAESVNSCRFPSCGASY
jgi:hypothetical protein